MSPPTKAPPPDDWEHIDLYRRVREAVHAAPGTFRSDVVIRGVQATDLFNLNALLGAAIEEGVVDTLNALRPMWDPDEEYALYSFVRQPQTFPDVRLQHSANPSDVLMGVELKGWYLLAKEQEPSFRFLATPAVCAPADLFVVYPWHLTEIISGVPKLMPPFVELARYVAEFRNYHWTHVMEHKKSAEVQLSESTNPYPSKADEISDQAVHDSGRNFGRIARTGLMNDFTSASGEKLLSGIPAMHWRKFFKIFTESATSSDIDRALERLSKDVAKSWEGSSGELDELLEGLGEVLQKLIGADPTPDAT